MSIKSLLSRIRSRLTRPTGVEFMKARDDLDRKLAKYLPSRGFFIEAGGFDGITVSNTYYLQYVKGWRGLLVEPDPELYELCCENRPGASVVHSALVEDSVRCPSIEMTILTGDRSMSFVGGATLCEKALKLAGEYENKSVRVSTSTVSEILDASKENYVDFFSLDVEGFEAQAIRGIDFDRHRVECFLIECLSTIALEDVQDALGTAYRLESRLTDRDFLFCRI